jgi:FkbM family methyltransferase
VIVPEAFNRLKQCRHGQLVYNINDRYVGRSLDLYGEYSEGEIDLFRQIVRPGSSVLEIGANIGSHTVFLARQVGPHGTVLAFEPQRVVFQTLCANVALGSFMNVLTYQQAVGAAPGSIIVPRIAYHQEGNFGGVALGTHQHGERVPLTTIDQLELSRCNFIKIDVEGMEQDVLAGGTRTIAQFKPVLYLENDKDAKSASLTRYIDSLGYVMYWHLPPLFNPNNFFGNPQNVFQDTISINMLCLHRDEPYNMQGFERVEVPPDGPSPSG